MYLERLHLRGFRSAADTTVSFRPGVTVLVGENNAGKSNVMDAIRLLTLPLDGKGSGLYPDRDDLHRDGCEDGAHTEECRTTFELSARYRSNVPGDLDMFSQAFDEDDQTASYHLTVTPPPTGFRRAAMSWRAGDGATTDLDPEPRARERIRHLYLPPLRDAQRELASSSGGRIQLVVERLLRDDEAREKFLQKVGEQFEAVEAIDPLPQAIAAVRTRLTRLTEGAHPQTADLGFADASVSSIARGLRLRMEQAGLDPRDLAESGLGYANLLFMAAVLTQLQDAAEADLTLLLVEEPEAHLHPQLQTILLHHLAEEARASHERQPEPGSPWLGRVQVIVTTHSPHVATAVDPRNLVVLQRRPWRPRPATDSAATAAPEAAAPSRPSYQTTAVAVHRLGLDKRDHYKIRSYLNATRSTLLFGQRVLLVEGIAEAILLPEFARLTLADECLQRFHGTALVPIDGVDFEPYLRVLLHRDSESGQRIARRVAVITDGDTGSANVEAAQTRIRKLSALIAASGARDIARVFHNEFTLEPEILRAGGPNRSLLMKAWQEQRPKGWADDWKTVGEGSPDEQAKALSELLKDKNKIRKGDLAQALLAEAAARPAEAPALAVPDYLRDALAWITEATAR
ncbi:ATP-dependent nuclease [Streptomyces rubradiris]|uniref:ATP-dependent endonuclease n=1 Tax=Streptomyces rubradiris TaxID=285531 RepID=A0ABQ3RDB8_STRRR|nr:AAA family ATPase [Streptomyces rubradiris]GHG95205.1 ATP-dependent endonuclease [Streptomyces rubradiris]GHI53843.1 ATP-dependent endonuclease [Streptomyces rubradiris]